MNAFWMLPADSSVRTRPAAFATRRMAVVRPLVVVLLFAAALVPRISNLAASGFSEDEINKLHAVAAYRRLDFTANAEHPMLMKLAVWGSMAAADRWNDRAPFGVTIAPEAALRAPNAILGAAIGSLVFLFGEAVFDATVGAWAGLLWAFDANATAINRIAKEDTFLVFFLFLAAVLYEKAKFAAAPARRQYGPSAAAFGCMLASKYMPHFFGLHAIYNVAGEPNPEDKTPDKRLSFYTTMGAWWLAANFAVALPATWRYILAYSRGAEQLHTGYDYGHRLYVNTIGASPWGLPPSFYFVFFGTKVPLAVLAASAAGLVWTMAHPRHRGAAFIRVFLVLTLLPYSFAASKFLRYMLPVLAVVDLAAAVGVVWVVRAVLTRRPTLARACAAALLVAGAAGGPFLQQLRAAPFYGFAQNVVGVRLFPPGSLFPDDEMYDAGVREATAAIADAVPPGAVVCSDAAAVVGEYLATAGRRDVRSCSIARDGLPMPPADVWLVAQPGHIYFENADVIEQVRRTHAPWLRVEINGTAAVEVFHVRTAPTR